MWGAQQDSQGQGRPSQVPLTTPALQDQLFSSSLFSLARAQVPLPVKAQKRKAQKINLLSRGGADKVVLIQEI